MREEITNISYTEWWLEYARKELAEKPDSVLHDYTHPNYSGGVSGWEEYIDHVYFSPQTFEEQMLRMQVHEIMLIALENAFRKAEVTEYEGKWTAWKGMHLAEAYRVSSMVVHVDPLLACNAKMRLNRIAGCMGTNLYTLGECNFQMFMGATGIRW